MFESVSCKDGGFLADFSQCPVLRWSKRCTAGRYKLLRIPTGLPVECTGPVRINDPFFQYLKIASLKRQFNALEYRIPNLWMVIWMIIPPFETNPPWTPAVAELSLSAHPVALGTQKRPEQFAKDGALTKTEKWHVSMKLGDIYVPYIMENKKCLKPPTSHGECVSVLSDVSSKFSLVPSQWTAGSPPDDPPQKMEDFRVIHFL